MSASRTRVTVVLSVLALILAGAAPAMSRSIGSSASCPRPGGQPVGRAEAPRGAVKIYGGGWGHGLGMSQYGAQGAARLGCGYTTILRTYYPGTRVVKRATPATVTLTLASATRSVRVKAESGAVEWRKDSRRVAVQPQDAVWQVVRTTRNGVRGVAALDGLGKLQAFAAAGSRLRVHDAGTVVRVKPRGAAALRTRWGWTRFSAVGSGIAANHVIPASSERSAVQRYLAGIAEVPTDWPRAALRAQAVAARTYLVKRYDRSLNSYVLSTGTKSQVYTGYDHEYADAVQGGHWRAAVDATARQVIIDRNGRLIDALYSSSMGGRTELPRYVYGTGPVSYLRSVDDSRWDRASDNPRRAWSKGLTRKAFAQRLGFRSVSSWHLAKRGSAKRANGLTVTGVRNGHRVTVRFTGTEARYRLGLLSTGFTVPRPD